MPVKIAFIGANIRSHAHWLSLRDDSDIQCVGVCDARLPHAKLLAKRCGAPAWASARALFENAKPDAAWICLPPHAHREAETLCVQNGCAMVVELPLGASLETAKRIRRETKEQNILCVPSLPHRYDETFLRLRKLLGKPTQIAVQSVAAMAAEPLESRLKSRVKTQVFAQYASHAAPVCDVMRWLGGGVREVMAIGIEESNEFRLAATFVLHSGAWGQWSLHCCPRAIEKARWLFSAGQNLAQIDNGELRLERGSETTLFRAPEAGLWAQNRAFLEAVRDGKRAILRGTLEDAAANLRVVLALEKSRQTRQWVKLGHG